MRRLLTTCTTLVLLTGLATSSSAEPRFDECRVILAGGNQLMGGDGTGWNNGDWIDYLSFPKSSSEGDGSH